MHTRPFVEFTTVPSFRRRLRLALNVLARVAPRRALPRIPSDLREDIGLTHGIRRRRANAPPDGNPYWRI